MTTPSTPTDVLLEALREAEKRLGRICKLVNDHSPKCLDLPGPECADDCLVGHSNDGWMAVARALSTWEAGRDGEREAPALALLREWSSDMMDADRMNCGADYRGPCLDEAGDPIADRTRACWEHRRWWLIAPAEPSPSPPVRDGGPAPPAAPAASKAETPKP